MRTASRRKIAKAFVYLLNHYTASAVIPALAEFIADQHRFRDQELLLHDIQEELLQQRKHLVVEVATARPLSPSLEKQLNTALKQAFQAEVIETQARLDPALVGGFVARTPSFEIDASIHTELQKLSHYV